jgi:hypothetical protein
MAVTRLGQWPFEQNYPQSPAQADRGLMQRYGDLYTFGEGSTKPFTGSRSLEFQNRANAGFGLPIAATSDDLRVGWFWSANVPDSSDDAYVRLMESNNSTALLSIYLEKTTWTLQLYVAGAVVQEVSLTKFPHFLDQRGVYTHHSFHLLGGSRFVYTIDGRTALDYSDASVPTGVEYVWLMENFGWGYTQYIDDLYIEDVAGESYAIPQSYRYFPSIVDGDGGSQDWAGYPVGGNDYEKVDDPGVDDDDTYVWIGAANSVEMFNTAAITTAVMAVTNYPTLVSAIPWALARKRDVSKASQIRMKADDGVGITSGSDKNLPGFYGELWDRFLLDPQSASWNLANFDACEFGFESRGVV